MADYMVGIAPRDSGMQETREQVREIIPSCKDKIEHWACRGLGCRLIRRAMGHNEPERYISKIGVNPKLSDQQMCQKVHWKDIRKLAVFVTQG